MTVERWKVDHSGGTATSDGSSCAVSMVSAPEGRRGKDSVREREGGEGMSSVQTVATGVDRVGPMTGARGVTVGASWRRRYGEGESERVGGEGRGGLGMLE